ncbi:NADP-dependent oxidoreductase domain-containing protein [Trichoderma austrokoningii]
MSEDPYVTLTIGTHTSAPNQDEKIQNIISIMRARNIKNLDSARLYGGGASETAIGNLHLDPEFAVDTKVPTGFVKGQADKIEQTAKDSLAALQMKQVRTYFFHGPDETVPFQRLGVSNFTLDQVLSLYNVAKEKGYVLPSVYQCSYSIASRHNEADLFPTLRKLGFSIQAYSPMAGGFLAKTPEYIEQGQGSWNPDTPAGKFQRGLLYKPSYMKMLAEFGTLSEKSGISRAGLAYRWVRHHSILSKETGDEVIIGASTSDQLADTMKELEGGPLEPWIAQRMEELWDMVKHEAPVDNLKSFQKVFC